MEDVSKILFSGEHSIIIEQRQSLKLLDVNRWSSPEVTLIKIQDDQRLGAFEVDPHDPNIVAISVLKEGFQLVDRRTKSDSPIVISKTSITITFQHSQPWRTSPMNRTKWNPFIPYWIAASCEEGIGIFDLRYNSQKPQRFLSMPHATEV